MTPRPIAIVGGGLAGLSLGLALRRQHVPVTIHEAGNYPRHRVCGEFITGLAAATIDRLGLADALSGALKHREVAWFSRDRPPHIHQLPEPALGLSRHALDARLAEKFEASGGTLRVGSRLGEPADRPGVVWATGRRRATAPKWIGLKLHARNLALTRDLEMHLGSWCYLGLTQVEHGAVNVCGLFRRRPLAAPAPELLIAYLRAAGLIDLADRLSRSVIVPESCCAVAALAFDRKTTPTNRVSLGDASAMIPPFTGNGMAMAFQSAELALDPLLAYTRGAADWADTRAAIQGRLRTRFRVRLATAGALHPFLLKPRPQGWISALGRAHLLPFRPLYATLH
ncbi:MAG: hypothetical protein ABIQ12_13280 [Opitutaceae bacterium]